MPLAQYAAISPSGDFFALLAQRLTFDKDWNRLAELIKLQEQANPADENLPPWQAELLYQRGQHEALAEQFAPQADQWVTKYRYAYQTEGNVIDRLLRSLIHLRRFDEALAIARHKSPELNNAAVWQAWIHLSQGSVEQAIAALDGPTPQRSHYQVYQDAEFSKLALAPEALPLRQRFPPQLPTVSTGQRAELWLSQAPDWDESSLTGLAREALGADAEASELTELEKLPGTSAWQVTSDSGDFLVFAGQRSSELPAEELATLSDERLAQASEQHQAWIVIVSVGVVDETQLTPAIYKLAAALAGEHATALRLSDVGRVFVVDALFTEILKSADAAKQLKSLGEPLAGWLVQNESGPDEQADGTQQHLAFARRMAEQPPLDHPRACVRLESYGCWEDVWFRVERIEGKPSRYSQFVISSEQPSLLLPELKLGEPYLASTYQLRKVQETTEQAADQSP